MKATVLLLAMLTLLLSVNPCCDERDGCAEEATADCPDHPEKEPAAEAPCSPFYTCGNCTGFTFQSDLSFFPVAALAVNENFTCCYHASMSVGYLSPPLKPPRRS